jgi:transketolase
MFRSLLERAASHYGNVCIRTQRRGHTSVYEDGGVFDFGGSVELGGVGSGGVDVGGVDVGGVEVGGVDVGNVEGGSGNDIAILAVGLMAPEAVTAAKMLAGEGISARVIDMYSLKPIDEAAVLKAARETGALVTAENHNRIGGLYSAVSEYLAGAHPCPVEWVAVNDEFGEVGNIPYLKERYKLNAEEIVRKSKVALQRKGGNLHE